MLQPKVHTITSRLNNTGLHPDKWQGYPLTGQPFFAPLPHFSMGQLQDLSKLEQPTAAATAYELVSDPAHLEEVVQEYLATSTVLAVDTETTGLDPLTAQLLLVQIATPNKCFIFDATRLPSLAPLKPVL